MQATEDDSLWRVRKRSGQFLKIHPPIATWNQDTLHKTRKDLNQII